MSSKSLVAAIGCGGTMSLLGRDSTDVLDDPQFGTKMPIAEELQRLDKRASASAGCCDCAAAPQHLLQTASADGQGAR
jgi:hypothetical protein